MTVNESTHSSVSKVFDESGKTALYAVQTIFNLSIILLMTANSQSVYSAKLTKFQRATQWLVIATLSLCIVGIYSDYNNLWLMQEICFQTLKILFIVFNYVICHQLNESLNHNNTLQMLVLVIIACSILIPMCVLPWNIAFRGTYPSNTILSLYSLQLLYQIKSIGEKRSKGASMQLLSMLRIELMLFLLNIFIVTENLFQFIDYQHPLVWGIRTCIWLLYLQKIYIVSVYFTGSDNTGSGIGRNRVKIESNDGNYECETEKLMPNSDDECA